MSYNIVFLDRDSLPPQIVVRTPDIEHNWQDYPNTEPDEVIRRLATADIAIINKVVLDKDIINNLPRLKMIAAAATGTDMIDIKACAKKGVVVSNIRNYATTSVPEHTFALILALRRQLKAFELDIKNGLWQKSPTFCLFTREILDLKDSTLGIIGQGSIGKSVAQIAIGFGMRVIFSELKNKAPRNDDYVSFDDLLNMADIISLHCPLNTETRNLFGKTEFSKMKSSAILINTARGGIVNEKDLAAAITNKDIAGAGFDVLTKEPPAAENVLVKLTENPRFILSPHTAWASNQAMQALANQLIDNIEAFATGEPQNMVS